MALMSAPPMYPQPNPYGYQQPMLPQGQYPPPSQPPQSQQQTPQTSQLQTQVKKIKCWNCGEEVPADAKFCPYCGASLTPIKCPKCVSSIRLVLSSALTVVLR